MYWQSAEAFIYWSDIFSSVTIRLKSITNIQKITKSMKMVAAAKYARAEKQLKPARIYGNSAMGRCLPAGSVYLAVLTWC